MGHMIERDRDESGGLETPVRASAMGRPLPPGSEGVPRIPDELELTPAATLAYAQDLLDGGLAFNAHEVLEGRMEERSGGGAVAMARAAQLAVGITHVQRATPRVPVAVLRRASGRLADARVAPHGIDAAGWPSGPMRLSTISRPVPRSRRSGWRPV